MLDIIKRDILSVTMLEWFILGFMIISICFQEWRTLSIFGGLFILMQIRRLSMFLDIRREEKREKFDMVFMGEEE